MKKRFDRLLLWILIVCFLMIPTGFADGEDAGDPAPEIQVSATPETATPVPETPAPATPEPVTEEPTQEPDAEPTAELTQEPTSEPTQTPDQDTTSEPGSEPTLEPTSEPTLEPTHEPTLAPDTEPTASPSVSPAPTATPVPLPGEIGELISIIPEGMAQLDNDVWRIQLSAPDSMVAFGWTVSGEATGHLVYVQNAQGEMQFVAETQDARIALSSANYMQGQYTLYVGSLLTDGSITWGKAVFELSFQGGGFPGGGSPGGAMSMGGMPAEEQGFRVTPGEALTSKHASGTKDTTAYTYSEIGDSEEAITALYLSSTQTEITLDDGALFFAFEEDGKLSLIPETDGACWHLNALAMNTLADSGIDRVVFRVGSTSYSLQTRMEFDGNVYASLRAEGYVSKDMEICVDAQGIRIYAAGGIYSISDHGELVPCEE